MSTALTVTQQTCITVKACVSFCKLDKNGLDQMAHDKTSKSWPRTSREDEVYDYLVKHLNEKGKMPANLTQAAIDLDTHAGTLHRILGRLVDDNRLLRVDQQLPYRIPSCSDEA